MLFRWFLNEPTSTVFRSQNEEGAEENTEVEVAIEDPIEGEEEVVISCTTNLTSHILQWEVGGILDIGLIEDIDEEELRG